MDRTVIALFASFAGAAHGIELLQRAGFSAAQIGIVAQSDVVRDHLGEDQDRRVLESVGAGVVGGSLFGGLAGLLTGAVALILPGIGPVIAGGALVTVLGATAAGAGIGAAFGSLAGALIGLGMSEEQAHIYVEGVRQGYLLVVVETDQERMWEATNVLEQADALDVSNWTGSWETQPAAQEALSTSAEAAPETVQTLRELIGTSHDSKSGLQIAAKNVSDAEDRQLAEWLRSLARQFDEFATTLQKQVEQLGGDSDERGSVKRAVQHGWINIKAAMTIESEQTKQVTLSATKDLLEAAVNNYREALDAYLPDRTRSIVENQYRQIQDAHRHTVELEQKSKSQEG